MLDVLQAVEYENAISKVEFRSYKPYTESGYNYNDEIRINVNNLNFVNLSESFLHLQLTVSSLTPETAVEVSKNFIPFLFSEVRLEQNSVTIESVKNPGLCSTIMNYLTLDEEEKKSASQYAWPGEVKKDSTRDFVIPLKNLLNFARDYQKLLIFSRLELILVRARNDNNCVHRDPVPTASQIRISIDKIKWFVPHVQPADAVRLRLLKVLENGKQISMPFRSIETHEYPGIPANKTLSWQVKSSTVHPLYVIIGMQTKRKDTTASEASVFDHVNLRDCRLFLNSDTFPYESMALDWDKDKYGLAYQMMLNTRNSLSGKGGSCISREEFKSEVPLICFDTSHFDPHVKNAITDIKVDMEFDKAVPAETNIIMLIISEVVINYNPFTNLVHKE